MIVSCPVSFVDKSDGTAHETVAVYYVDPAKKAYVRIKNVFKADRRMLLALATSVDTYEDVLRAAGLTPRAPQAKAEAPAKK